MIFLPQSNALFNNLNGHRTSTLIEVHSYVPETCPKGPKSAI